MRRTLLSNESVAEAHFVSISVYCRQSCTSRNVPTRSNPSTATNSARGAQSARALPAATSRCRVWSYSRTLRVSGPASPMDGRAGTAGKDVRKVLGPEDARTRRAHVGDGIDRTVGVVGRHERCQVVEGHGERHAHIERSVSVDADPPTRGLQAPIGLHVHGHEPVLGEADPVDPPDTAGDHDALWAR